MPTKRFDIEPGNVPVNASSAEDVPKFRSADRDNASNASLPVLASMPACANKRIAMACKAIRCPADITAAA